MKEVEMYDAFQLPAPSQSTLEYLSAGGTHEPASRIGVVQWQQCDTSCSALNNLRKESRTADQQAFPFGSNYGLKTTSNRNVTSTTSARISSTSSTSGPSSRRKADKSCRGRRSTAKEPSNSMQEAVPQLADMIKNVVSNINDQAQLKKHHMEKKRRQALAERSAGANRALGRTSSGRQALPVKKQPLSRNNSKDVLRNGGAPSTSRTKDSLKDMQWVPTVSSPMVRKDSEGDSGFEESFTGEASRSVEVMELPSDAYLIPEESLPRTRRCITTQDLMPPPPKPPKPHVRPPQPKPTPVPPAPATRDLPCTSPFGVSSSQFIKGHGQPPPVSVSSSQSHRPPALGMRRTNAYSSTSNTTTFSSSQNLPNKQRGFKTPFARPPTASQLSATSSSLNGKESSQVGRGSQVWTTAVRAPPSPPLPPVRVARERSPSPGLDPDSSYGEISFDMDIIEETMKQYDEF